MRFLYLPIRTGTMPTLPIHPRSASVFIPWFQRSGVRRTGAREPLSRIRW